MGDSEDDDEEDFLSNAENDISQQENMGEMSIHTIHSVTSSKESYNESEWSSFGSKKQNMSSGGSKESVWSVRISNPSKWSTEDWFTPEDGEKDGETETKENQSHDVVTQM